MGLWKDADKLEIAIIRLSDVAKQFYNGCLEMHAPGVMWQKFKDVFRHRFRDTQTDQYHFMRLQTVRQSRNESIQEFADRCRTLAQKIVRKVDDPAAQRIHHENLDRMLLASFVVGLTGIPGRQVRFLSPQSLDQALKTALSVQEAENFSKSFYTSFDNSLRVRSPSPTRHADHRSQPQLTRGMRQLRREVNVIKPHVAAKSQRPQEAGTRGPKLHLYAMSVRGLDTSRECPTRLNREANSTNSPGKRNPSERSKPSRSSGEKSTLRTGRECEKKITSQGNAREV